MPPPPVEDKLDEAGMGLKEQVRQIRRIAEMERKLTAENQAEVARMRQAMTRLSRLEDRVSGRAN